jgi:hypothetical protein
MAPSVGPRKHEALQTQLAIVFSGGYRSEWNSIVSIPTNLICGLLAFAF